MQLYSTAKKSSDVSFKEAVFSGLPPDNGLYMPHHIPVLPDLFFKQIGQKSLPEIAFEVSSALLQGAIEDQYLKKIVEESIDFDAPLVPLNGQLHVLELFHGPSLAFKDFGARFMARTMQYFLERENKEIHILVATSGDTGSAVAQGFLGVPHVKVTILYPSGKVSPIQEMQLTTLGQNITALEVEGTFDDCQRMVKEAFLDKELRSKINLSSANSINICRLLPQSFYYFYAYARLPNKDTKLFFSVPSGNFGNLSAGVIAYKMGLPVHRFVASTNANNVVPAYLQTGVFEPRPSVQTISNSMDVGNPSNFYRLLALYNDSIDEMKRHVRGYSFSDKATLEAIHTVYTDFGYTMDPHTAVAYLGVQEAMRKEPSGAGIVLATAHPAKFGEPVQLATGKEVTIPERLQEAMQGTKTSFQLKPSFADLKQFLLR
jgi:threonine synthase